MAAQMCLPSEVEKSELQFDKLPEFRFTQVRAAVSGIEKLTRLRRMYRGFGRCSDPARDRVQVVDGSALERDPFPAGTAEPVAISEIETNAKQNDYANGAEQFRVPGDRDRLRFTLLLFFAGLAFALFSSFALRFFAGLA